jgi:hypothetical protein
MKSKCFRLFSFNTYEHNVYIKEFRFFQFQFNPFNNLTHCCRTRKNSVAKSSDSLTHPVLASSCPSVSLSVRLLVYIGATPTKHIYVKFYIGYFHVNMSRNLNLVKRGQNIEQFTWRPKHVSLFPATLKSHKQTLFEGNQSYQDIIVA